MLSKFTDLVFTSMVSLKHASFKAISSGCAVAHLRLGGIRLETDLATDFMMLMEIACNNSALTVPDSRHSARATTSVIWDSKASVCLQQPP